MTDAQLARLPETLRDIVKTDRALAEWRGEAIVQFDTIRRLRSERADLRRAAESRWGHRAGGDSTSRNA